MFISPRLGQQDVTFRITRHHRIVMSTNHCYSTMEVYTVIQVNITLPLLCLVDPANDLWWNYIFLSVSSTPASREGHSNRTDLTAKRMRTAGRVWLPWWLQYC